MDKFTIGDLKRELAGWPDDTEICFAGGLTFYRLKNLGDRTALFDWNEMEAELTDRTRKTIKVAFMRMPDHDDDNPVQTMTVPRL
ncbi:MAG: hypothetical protein ACK46Q_03810 [Hyphomonas sp.]